MNSRSYEIDPSQSVVSLGPTHTLDSSGTMRWMPDGTLFLMEHDLSSGVHTLRELVVDVSVRERNHHLLKKLRGSSMAAAIAPSGDCVALGAKTVRVFELANTSASVSCPSVKYHLAWNTIGFSPSGGLLAIGDSGYISPVQRNVMVCDRRTGQRVATVRTDEWCFRQIAMLDETNVVTLGLPVGWPLPKEDPRADKEVLSAYDINTGHCLFRRSLAGRPHVSIDSDAGLLWFVASDSDWLTHYEAVDRNGTIVESIQLKSPWLPTSLAPIAIGTRYVAVGCSRHDEVQRLVLIDRHTGAIIARLLVDPKSVSAAAPSPAASSQSLSLSACIQGKTLLWQLANALPLETPTSLRAQ